MPPPTHSPTLDFVSRVFGLVYVKRKKYFALFMQIVIFLSDSKPEIIFDDFEGKNIFKIFISPAVFTESLFKDVLDIDNCP